MYRLLVPLLAVTLAACGTKSNARFCDVSTPCGTALYPYCDLDKNECQASGPLGDASMPPDLSASMVDMTTVDLLQLVDANVDAAMPDQAPPAGCTVATDCTQAAAPICDVSSGKCRACNASTDDVQCAAHSALTPLCRLAKAGGPSVGMCALCNSNSDCTSTMSPVCDVTGVCRACTAHSDCSSGVCITDTGHCADSNDVAYIDNMNNSISACHGNGLIHDGAPTHPYCDIVDGIAAGKLFEKVTGHINKPYSPLTITNTNAATYTVVGPGSGVTNPATITNGNDPDVSVSLSVGGANAILILDGVELGDRSNSSSSTGLFCTTSNGATAKVTVRNSSVLHANGGGISSTSCALTVTGSTIGNNGTSGVNVSGGSAVLTNNLISANNNNPNVICNSNVTLSQNTISAGNPGVVINGGTATLDRNIIESNAAQGVNCPSGGGTATLTNNTISMNMGPGISNGSCTLTGAANIISSNTGDGVDCFNNTTTTLRSNTISKNSKGISCDGATLNLDSNQITGSTTFGVEIKNNATYSLINNFIFTNLGTGVQLSGSGKFIFNTVVENGNGVDCGGNNRSLEASIVWGNQSGTSTQFIGTKCMLFDVVTGTDSFANAVQLTPDFVNPSPSPGPIDLHLKTADAANSACCIDKIGGPLDGGTSPLPDHDIDGEARPHGAGFDVGADETQ